MASSNVTAFRAAHQAFNRRDFDGVVRQLAEDFTYRDHARSISFRGREGFREFMRGWVATLSNAEVSEPRYIDGGDVVVAEFTGRGVHDGALGPYAATGRTLDLPFCEIIRFNDRGQMISGAVYYDQLSLMVQLGLAQAPATASV